MHQLAFSDFPRVLPLFESLDYNLPIRSIIAGNSPGQIYSDNTEQPAAALAVFQHHMYLAGDPGLPEFNRDLKRLFEDEIIPELRRVQAGGFIVNVTDAWRPALKAVLSSVNPRTAPRQYFEATQLKQDWRPLLPPGFELRPVDAALLQEPLEDMDYLRYELVSERPTVEDFLQHSFGVALVTGAALAAWCLSEYNTADRCEVGVATVERFQRRKLGTLVSLALVEQALAQGYTRVGWHCWERNEASAKLAQRAGFQLVHDYNVELCLLEEE